MANKKKMKITKRLLDEPMTEFDFQQLTLIANLMAVCKRLSVRETNMERKSAFGLVMRDVKRIESSIKGYLDPRIAEGSADRFYFEMEKAVIKFLNSFKDAKPVGRDSNGRFVRL